LYLNLIHIGYIENNFIGVHDVFATDINKDGFLDILGARGDKKDKGEIAIWINNKKNKFKKHIVYSGVFCHSVSAADIDGDGNTDILGTQFKEGVRIWNNSGNLKFKDHFLPINGAHEVKVKDINKDGLPDILVAAYMSNSITIWENQGKFKFKQNNVSNKFLGAVTVGSGDLDGDGDTDIIGGSHGANDLRWWENTGSFNFIEHSIAGFLFSASGICAGDLDKDGDLDIAGGSWKGTGEVTWWENQRKILKNNRFENLSSRQFIKYLREQGIKKAKELYAKLKSENPNKKIFTIRQCLYLGYEFLRLKKQKESIKIFQLLITEYPEYANGYDSLAEAYMKSGNKNSAIKYYKKSLKLNPKNKNAVQKLKLLNLSHDKKYKNYKELSTDAIGFWRMGEKEKSIDLYKKALKLFPENNYKTTRNLSFMYMQLKQKKKVFEIYEYGHSQGLYYPFYIKSGPMAELMKENQFKKIYEKNCELIKKAEKNSKPAWNIITPDNYDKSKSYPLLVVLHGWSGSLKTITPIWKLTEHKKNILIAHLQSSQIAGIGAYTWNDINTTQKDIIKLLNYLKTK